MGKFDNIINWGSRLQQSILSLVKVALLSRRPSALPASDGRRELVILANGPSLNSTVAQHRDFLSDKALLAVNFCATSPLYTDLKPDYYVIADPLFWIVDEKRESLFGSLAKKTDWPMHLFMPARALADKKWRPMIEQNRNITVHIYNTTPVEGFAGLAHAIYRKGLGVPRPHNVLIPSIATALRMPFDTIYLTGADHSWLPEISVTDNNVVLMHQKHFYDRNTSQAATVMQENLSSAPLYQILYHMQVAFKAYFTLRDYAATLGKRIVNITPGSFIDAFERQILPTSTDGIVIQARSGSTRMPAKILQPFHDGRRIIDILLERIRQSCPGKKIILATTVNPADDVLEQVAREHGVDCFRGSEDDVLGRFIGAARKYGLKRLIRVCSDNPFLNTESFNTLFEASDREPADYVAFGFPDGRPTIKSHLGLFAELTTLEALERVAASTQEKLYREHVTIYEYTHPLEFTVRLLPLPDFLRERLDLRLTLDTPADFKLLSELYDRYQNECPGGLRDLVSLVDADPRYGAIMKQNIKENEK